MTRYLGSDISAEEVRQILDLVENSSFESLDLQVGDLRLSVSKTGNGPIAASQGVAPAAPVAVPAPPPPVSAQPAAPAPAPAASPEMDGAADRAGLVEITAPIVGVFYVAPEPGAPPFVDLGSEIDADATVGLVEVMKVFNGVKAGVAGTVVKRLVEDSAFVEHGQALYLVRPKAE